MTVEALLGSGIGLALATLFLSLMAWRDRRRRREVEEAERNEARLRRLEDAGWGPVVPASQLDEFYAAHKALTERYDGRPPSLVSELDAWQQEYDRACEMHEARVALRGLGPA